MGNIQAKKSTKKFKKNIKAQVWNFVSEPSLHPMKVAINVNKPGAAPGLIFVAPYTTYEETMIGQTGALIMEQDGNPVWFRPLKSRYKQNTDFRVQTYKGRPVLTMWQGTISGTQSSEPNLPAGDPEPGAYFQIINENYKVIRRLEAKRGYTADVHEFILTSRNTALFTAIKQIPSDLTPYGGPEDGYIDNYSIQEIDLETGELLFFWSALAHINPAESMISASSAVSSNNIWDCFHVNSVEEGPNDTLLISMRNMWAIYNISKITGDIIWQLGGKQSDFKFASNSEFSWQHDARHRFGNRISLFDDACCASSTSPPQGSARGLILKLDFQSMTANVDRTYYHNPLLFVPSQGNVQKLPNKNQFIGWGQEPYLSEFANAGNTETNSLLNFLYDMEFPNQNFSYRGFKNKWIGLPLYPPSIAAKSFHKSTIVYASWNGSTETVSWQVLAGPTKRSLSVVENCIPRTGFETKIKVNSVGPYFQVNALNSCQQTIGTSSIVYTHNYKERNLKGGIFMNSDSKYPLNKKNSCDNKCEEQCNCEALAKKMIYKFNYGNLGPIRIIFTEGGSNQVFNQPIASITIDTSCFDCPDIVIDFIGVLNVTPIISANSTLIFTLYRVCSNVMNRQEVSTFSFNVADTFGGVTSSHSLYFRSITKNECNDCCTYVLELTSIANIDLGPITYSINGTISALAIESC